MKSEEVTFPSANGVDNISGVIWSVEKPKFILQIVHGVSEYILRYDDFARYIGENGGIIFGIDHLGHGKSVGKNGLGYFSKKDGYKHLVLDAYKMTEIITQRYPTLPLFILGYSMGSFVLRSYLSYYKTTAKGIVLIGTSGTNKLVWIGKVASKLFCFIGLGKVPNVFMENIAFSKYMKAYPKSRLAWISKSEANIEKYIKDPLCGAPLTSRGCYDFIALLDSVSGFEWAQTIPKNISYLLISGANDPVGDYGKGVEEVYNHMKNAGVADVHIKLFEDMQHEILNEDNNIEVYSSILEFIQENLKGGLHAEQSEQQ